MLTLNEKPLATWYDGGNAATFKLEGFDGLHAAWDWAKTLEGQDLTIKQDGTARKVYGGYSVTDVGMDESGLVTMRAQRALEPATAAAIEALESNVSTATADAAGAVQTANAAMEAAQSAGTDPAVSAFARIAIVPMAADMTDAEAISTSTLWPEWSADGVQYAVGAVVQHSGHLWRCAQAHSSQADWTPEAAASLWSRIDIAADGIDVWTQPTGAHNAYNTGDKVHYPGKSDPVYVSTIDGNVWAPDAYPQGWQLEEAK